MCEGTALVAVVVATGFSGDVVLQADCRSEEFTILSGKSIRIGRHEDGESCGVSLFVDGEQVFDENIDGYESVTLTVNSNGEVDQERVVQ